MFGSLIDYWYYTNDDKYNNIVTEAILFQVGEDTNFEPSNQTKSLGNDDQAFWALAAMVSTSTFKPSPETTPCPISAC